MHVILTNGAPFSGKDTLVKNLLKRYPTAVWVRFKDILYKDSHARLFPTGEISLEQWIDICNNVTLKDKALPYTLTKEKINEWAFKILVEGKSPTDHNFGNMCDKLTNEPKSEDDIQFVELCPSPRNELIYQSENIIKVEHGAGGVAVRTAQNIIDNIHGYEHKLFIFSDGGFNIEVETLMKVLDIERKDLTIIRIDADGCTFDGDSREYIHNPDYTVFNDKTDNFFVEVEKHGIYEKFDNMVLNLSPFDYPEVYYYLQNLIEHVNFIKKVEYSINGERTVISGDKLITKWYKSLDWNLPPSGYDYFKVYTHDIILNYKWCVDGMLYERIVNT